MSYDPMRCYLCPTKMKQVPKSSSERIIRVGALNVGEKLCVQPCYRMPWNQSSDRVNAAGTGVFMSKPLGRPGGGVRQPIQSGVDIKHNSYDRRLRKLQAKVLSST